MTEQLLNQFIVGFMDWFLVLPSSVNVIIKRREIEKSTDGWGEIEQKGFLLVLDFFHKFSQKLLKNSFVIRQPEQIQYPETNLSSEKVEAGLSSDIQNIFVATWLDLTWFDRQGLDNLFSSFYVAFGLFHFIYTYFHRECYIRNNCNWHLTALSLLAA